MARRVHELEKKSGQRFAEVKQVSEEFGCSQRTVQNALKVYGETFGPFIAAAERLANEQNAIRQPFFALVEKAKAASGK